MITKKVFKKITLSLITLTTFTAHAVQVDAVALFANTSGTVLKESPVKIDTWGSVTGIADVEMYNNIYGATNIFMAGGNISGVNDLLMAGDITGANDLNLTGNIYASGDINMQGDINGVDNIHMTGGDIIGTHSISIEGSLTLNNPTGSINMSGGDITNAGSINIAGNLSGAQTIEVNNTLLINQIANISTPGTIVTWPTSAGSAGQYLGITAPGVLGYATPAGYGNVISDLAFTADDRIVTTSSSAGPANIQETNMTLDTSNNLSGVVTLSASTVTTNTLNAQVINALSGAATINTTYVTSSTINAHLVGNVTGAASLNVLKAGDSMTGNLNLATQSAIKFQQAVGSNAVSLGAPTSVVASYTLQLPGAAPLAGQFLQITATADTLYTSTWACIGGSPTTGRTCTTTAGSRWSKRRSNACRSTTKRKEGCHTAGSTTQRPRPCW